MLNDKAVSETVGVMLALAIFVIFISVLQVYEVPKWNKDIDNEHFSKVYDDFLSLRQSVITSSTTTQIFDVHMGTKYPNRLFLSGPSNSYGTITIEPTNITIKTPTSTINITSSRIIYQIQGQPTLIYEHGIIIRDYGNAQFSDQQSIFQNNTLSIPVIFSEPLSKSSILIESFPMFPSNTSETEINNISFDTKYPRIWESYSNLSVSGNTVSLKNTPKYIIYPSPPSSNLIFIGMITNKHIVPSTITMPPFTDIDPSKSQYPTIENVRLISLKDNEKEVSQSQLIATITNATSENIHADLTDLTKNIWKFNETPISYQNNIATWNITHPDYQIGTSISVAIWARNNGMQFYAERMFERIGNGWIEKGWR